MSDVAPVLSPAAGMTPNPALHAITSLRYRLYFGPVDLSPLVVRQVRHFAWREAQVSVFVLGASHAVTIRLPSGRTLTELLTCLPPDHGRQRGEPWNHEHLVPNLAGDSWDKAFQATGLRGRVRVHHIPLSANTDFPSFCSEDSLHEPFPLPTGETAWTRIVWREDGSDLSVETIHTYPEEGAAIRSTTRFVTSPSDTPPCEAALG